MTHESKGMQQAPELSARLRKVFAEFDKASIPLTREEVVWLTILCEKADRPLENGIPWQADSPIVYGGSVFWPLTPRADWWWRYWYKRFQDVPAVRAFIMLFACVKSEPGDAALRTLTDWQSIHDAVVDWSNTLDWPAVQYGAVYDKVLQLNGMDGRVQDPDEKPQPDEPLNVYNMHTALAKAYPGTTPDYWETCVSMTKQHQLIQSLRNLHEDNGSHPDSPKDQALGALYAAKKWIRKWHTGSTSLPGSQEGEQKAAKETKEEGACPSSTKATGGK